MRFSECKPVISVMLLLQVTSSVTSPVLQYDKEIYQYEDKLIRGDLDLQNKHLSYFFHHKPLHDTEEGHLILPQPLNYRLPHIPTKPPSFLGPSFLNITAAPGTTVVLPCRVLNIGSASLSWLRRPQLTVLSSGNTLFSSSPRLRLLHFEGSPDWTLQIGPLVTDDEGTYECQVNTEPKQSQTIKLNVMAGTQLSDRDNKGPGPALALQGDSSMARLLKTEILAPDTMRVEEGDTATLECVVTEHEAAPPYFTWYIHGTPLDFSQHRGGILLQTENRRRSSSSRLTLTRMSLPDSGSYTCSPAGGDSATIHIIVREVQNREFFFSSEDSSATTWSLQSFWVMASTSGVFIARDLV